jgi:hypothetical protein
MICPALAVEEQLIRETRAGEERDREVPSVPGIEGQRVAGENWRRPHGQNDHR